jgi:dTMP kinase
MFITLEGPEGSGKTSQIPPLVAFLQGLGYPVLATREPGGTPISDQVRQVLMNMDNKAMHPRTEILLFCASRAQHVEQFIRPNLNAGKIILCDRYADSTLAYQGYGHQNDLDFLHRLLDYATGGLKPDLTLLLDLDIETGLQRRRSSGGEWNRLDDYELAFHRRVRQGYLELAKSEPTRWKVVDASQDKDTVQNSMREIIFKELTR